jgi:hypothetical protein
MKCIMTLEGAADRNVKVLRVSDQEARGRVASGEAAYVSKTEWKKSRLAPKEGVGEVKVEPKV